jgi:HK97 family phage major capsid protein
MDIKNLEATLEKGFADLKSAQEKGQTDMEAKLAEHVAETAEKLQEATKAAENIKELEQKMTVALERADAGSQEEEKGLELKQAFSNYMRKGERGLTADEMKALSESVDTEGGYTVPAAMSNFIVSRVFETSPMRNVARTETISSNRLEMLIDDDEFATGKSNEKGTRSTTGTPDFGKLVIDIHEYYANPTAYNHMLEDTSLDIENYIASKAGDAIGRKQNTDFINGNGVDGAKGILQYDAWASAGVYERDALEQVNTGSAAALTVDGLINLQGALKEEYQPNAVWMMKRATFNTLLQLKGSDNYHFLNLQPTFAKEGKVYSGMSLLGAPVVFADDMPAIGSGALPIAYGDFGVGYTVVDHARGTNVIRDNITVKGATSFYTSRRAGGGVTNFDAIKLQKVSA